MCKSGVGPENIRIFLLDNCVHPVEGACVRFVDGKTSVCLSTVYTQVIHRRNVDNLKLLEQASNFPVAVFSSESRLLFVWSVKFLIPVQSYRIRA